MILVADGGSTKTDWRLLRDGQEFKQMQTSGFNPYLSGTDEIESILWKELQPYLNNTGISRIYYYGAGCSTVIRNQVVEQAFERVFPSAKICIDHDLIGAARALCGSNAGIAAILGTGSNSCFYDGTNIIDKIFSSGYLFGDEGSGAYMGKILLTAYLHDELPPVLAEKLNAEHLLSKESILENVYTKPTPNRFLASFSSFIFHNRDHPYLHELIFDNFRQFYKYQVCCYPGYRDVPVNFAGSVAYHYKELLLNVGQEFGIRTGKIIQSPIEGLVEYHLAETTRLEL